MLLPGLEDGLAPELYDEVIDILDPGLLDTIANADLESLDRPVFPRYYNFKALSNCIKWSNYIKWLN